MAGADRRPGEGQSGMSAHTGHTLGVVGLGWGGPCWALEDGASEKKGRGARREAHLR